MVDVEADPWTAGASSDGGLGHGRLGLAPPQRYGAGMARMGRVWRVLGSTPVRLFRCFNLDNPPPPLHFPPHALVAQLDRATDS